MAERNAFTTLGFQFLPDRYGWYCEALGACVQWSNLHEGWKAFRGNYDAVSRTEAALMAREPMIFATPEDAGDACAKIWGKS